MTDQTDAYVEFKKQEVGGRNLTQKEFINIRESRIEQTKNLAQLAGSATGLLTGSTEGVHQASHSSNTALTHNFNSIIRVSIPIGVVVNAVGEKAAKIMTGAALGSALKDVTEKTKKDSNSLSSSSFPTPYDSLPNSYLNEAVSSDIPESEYPVKEGKQEEVDSAKVNAENFHPSSPIGRKGNPIQVMPGTNTPATIGGRQYTGHSLDRMQGRGVPPSSVEDYIRTGNKAPGNTIGTTTHSVPGLKIITNSKGNVVTVIPQ